MDQVIAWILSLMTSVSPVGRPQYVPEAKESVEEATVRYDSIAKDVIDVVFDPNEKPLFSGAKARIKTVSVLLAVANFESGGFRKDVDLGEGKKSKGDQGSSWCLNQVNLGKVDSKGNTPRRIVVDIGKGFKITSDQTVGWSGPDLVTDRKKCFHAALAVMRSSFSSCGNTPLDEKLQQYASGSCGKGILESKRRMRLALLWMGRAPAFKDQDVIDLVAQQEKSPEDPTSDFRLVLNFSSYSSNPISFSETYQPLLKLESL